MLGTSYPRASWWIGCIFGGLVFLACWIGAIAKWGFLLGAAFGWIPAAIIGVIAAGILYFLWPIILGLMVFGAYASWYYGQ